MLLSFFTDALFTTTDFYMSMMVLLLVLTFTLLLTAQTLPLSPSHALSLYQHIAISAPINTVPFIVNADVKNWLAHTFKRSAQPDDEADSSYS